MQFDEIRRKRESWEALAAEAFADLIDSAGVADLQTSQSSSQSIILIS